jgi:hypothetical protein
MQLFHRFCPKQIRSFDLEAAFGGMKMGEPKGDVVINFEDLLRMQPVPPKCSAVYAPNFSAGTALQTLQTLMVFSATLISYKSLTPVR